MILGIFMCVAAVAIDGDTLKCGEGIGRVRLAGIDAPEMPGHCRRGRKCAPGDPFMARDVLTYQLGQLDGKEVWCEQTDADPKLKGFQEGDRWGRPVARCYVDGKDVTDALLSGGFVVRWP